MLIGDYYGLRARGQQRGNPNALRMMANSDIHAIKAPFVIEQQRDGIPAHVRHGDIWCAIAIHITSGNHDRAVTGCELRAAPEAPCAIAI